MEIKDITLSAERLEEVRGGQHISSLSLGAQVGANQAFSTASSFGIGNTTGSSVQQDASQSFGQQTVISAKELDSHVLGISNSMISTGWGLPKML